MDTNTEEAMVDLPDTSNQPFHRMPSQRRRKLWTLAARAGMNRYAREPEHKTMYTKCQQDSTMSIDNITTGSERTRGEESKITDIDQSKPCASIVVSMDNCEEPGNDDCDNETSEFLGDMPRASFCAPSSNFLLGVNMSDYIGKKRNHVLASGNTRRTVRHQKSSTETSGLGSSLDWASTETLNVHSRYFMQTRYLRSGGNISNLLSTQPTAISGNSSRGASPIISYEMREDSGHVRSRESIPETTTLQSMVMSDKPRLDAYGAARYQVRPIGPNLSPRSHTYTRNSGMNRAQSLDHDCYLTQSQAMKSHSGAFTPKNKTPTNLMPQEFERQRRATTGPCVQDTNRCLSSKTRPLIVHEAYHGRPDEYSRKQYNLGSNSPQQEHHSPRQMQNYLASHQQPFDYNRPVRGYHNQLLWDSMGNYDAPDRHLSSMSHWMNNRQKETRRASCNYDMHFPSTYPNVQKVNEEENSSVYHSRAPQHYLKPPRTIHMKSLDEEMIDYGRPSANNPSPTTQSPSPRSQHPHPRTPRHSLRRSAQRRTVSLEQDRHGDQFIHVCSAPVTQYQSPADSISQNNQPRRSHGPPSSILSARMNSLSFEEPSECHQSVSNQSCPPDAKYSRQNTDSHQHKNSLGRGQNLTVRHSQSIGHVQFRINGDSSPRIVRPADDCDSDGPSRSKGSAYVSTSRSRNSNNNPALKPGPKEIEIHPESPSEADRLLAPITFELCPTKLVSLNVRDNDELEPEERVPTPLATLPLSQRASGSQMALSVKLSPLELHRLTEYWDHAIFMRTRLWGQAIASIASICLVYAISSNYWLHNDSVNVQNQNVSNIGLWKQCNGRNSSCQITFPFFNTVGHWKSVPTCVLLIALFSGLSGIGLSVVGLFVSSLPKQLYYFHSGGEVLFVAAMATAFSAIIWYMSIPVNDQQIRNLSHGPPFRVTFAISLMYALSAFLLLFDEIIQELTKLAGRHPRLNHVVNCLFSTISTVHRGRKSVSKNIISLRSCHQSKQKLQKTKIYQPK